LSVGAGLQGDVSTIRGKVVYRGTAEGPVRVEVFERPQFSPRPVYSAVISGAEYEASVRSGTYYLRAYIDVNRNEQWDEGEPLGTYEQGRAVMIVPLASKLGIDIKIVDGKKAVEEPEKK
jgi:hypothetical protein